MLATGIDLVDIDRIGRAVERFGRRFVDRVFTPAEQQYCRGRPSALAARFAAKEATAKLLGTGIGRVAWREIEVTNNVDGRPSLILHGAAEALASSIGIREISLSLTHERSLAIAFVVAQGRER